MPRLLLRLSLSLLAGLFLSLITSAALALFVNPLRYAADRQWDVTLSCDAGHLILTRGPGFTWYALHPQGPPGQVQFHTKSSRMVDHLSQALPPWGAPIPIDQYTQADRFAFGWPARTLWGGHNSQPLQRWGTKSLGYPSTTQLRAPDREWALERRFPIGLIPRGLLLNTAFYSTCSFLLAASFSASRRHLRRRRGLCPHCCYNLTGNTTGICPECGVKAG
jgi:hypothetical protein